MTNEPNKARILVVDDEEHIRSTVSELLTAADHTVVAAPDGISAMSILEAKRFDLLIPDIRMPGMTGIELLKEARALHPDLGVILITGSADLEAALDALRSGAQELLLKPFRAEDLHKAVDSALQKRQDARELSRLRALAPLIELGRHITSVDDIDQLAHSILEIAIGETDADGGSLMLIDERNETLYIEASQGISPDVAKAARQRLGEGISGWVAQNNTPLVLGKKGTKGDGGMNLSRSEISSALSIPLVIAPPGGVGHVTLGVLNVNKMDGKRPFAQSDLDMLTVLCSQVSVALRSMQLYGNLQGAYVGIIKALASAVDTKDSYTAGHSERVAEFAKEIAIALALDPSFIDAIHHAGLLHDIGKIGVADAILKKPGRLTEDEFREMRNHADMSYRILEPVEFPHDIKPMVRHHHEWFNGAGYPDGLAGETIPLGARILSVADAYEAMTSDRPYRKALPNERAVTELMNYAGTQFDPGIVEAFLSSPAAEVDTLV